MNLLASPESVHAHAVEIAGGPQSVIDALATSLTNTLGYKNVERSDRPIIHLVVDAMDEHPNDVVIRYVSRALQSMRRPIPLFLTANRKPFQRRGLAWEDEFIYSSGSPRVHELAARMRILVHLWGDSFPIDVIRDAVVGSFRMMMQLDADDYHHRSPLIEDLQRITEWDGSGNAPTLRGAPDNAWQPPLPKNHAYSALFPNAWREIAGHMGAMLAEKDLPDLQSRNRARDLASTIIRKIPGVSGRSVHALGAARPQVLIIDDEATEMVAALSKHRVGNEDDSASLDEIFQFRAEVLTLKGEPSSPPHFMPEEWIRERVIGSIAPGGSLIDLRCADLILLDLSLSQGQESELAGFVLLEKLRKAIPDIPLVIHTGSAALGHIIQAIRNGADWYVRKDTARPYSELASILHDIGRRLEWEKRARRLSKERDIAGDLDTALRRDELLFIWRSLAADLPKGELHVLPFSAGLSGAMTCGVHIVEPADAGQHSDRIPLTSFVAKIDRPYVMVSERERYRRLVRPRIGNRAGRIDSDVVYAGPNVAGIAYTFSGIHQGPKGSHTSIEPLGRFLHRRLNSNNARFLEVAHVFEDLLDDLLEPLHRSKPRGERDSWIEPLFGETLTLRDSHELRLPPLFEIELTAFSDAESDATVSTLPTSIGSEIHLPVCRVQKARETDFSVVFYNKVTGRAHRAQLTGELAHFLARFRNLRPNRALSVTGRIVRTRADFYDAVRGDLADDLAWLYEKQYPSPFEGIDVALDVFDSLESEVVGIIHGDLNLNNILIDVAGNGLPPQGALWLIDFARTRRDSLAHDFVELEVDLVTSLLGSSTIGVTAADIMQFLQSLDAGALDVRSFDVKNDFVNDACQFIRRAAAAAKIEKIEYLATLLMYYLITLKLSHSMADFQKRRWSLFGASAALDALEKELERRVDIGPRARLPVKRSKAQTMAPFAEAGRTRPVTVRKR